MRSGATQEEPIQERNTQINRLTNPTQNFQFGSDVITGEGIEILDVQSERGSVKSNFNN